MAGDKSKRVYIHSPEKPASVARPSVRPALWVGIRAERANIHELYSVNRRAHDSVPMPLCSR